MPDTDGLRDVAFVIRMHARMQLCLQFEHACLHALNTAGERRQSHEVSWDVHMHMSRSRPSVASSRKCLWAAARFLAKKKPSWHICMFGDSTGEGLGGEHTRATPQSK